MLLVLAQELAAGGKFVVHDVEYFTINAWFETSQDDSVSAVVHVSQWKDVCPTQVEENTKSINADASAQRAFAGAKYGSWPQDNIRQGMFQAVLPD